MIKFKAVKNAEGKIIHFSVSGHAGYSEAGSDIVCASVSSAVWMAVNGIEKLNLAELLYKQDDAFVECSVSEKRMSAADALLESLVLLIEELASQYEDFVIFTQEIV